MCFEKPIVGHLITRGFYRHNLRNCTADDRGKLELPDELVFRVDQIHYFNYTIVKYSFSDLSVGYIPLSTHETSTEVPSTKWTRTTPVTEWLHHQVF